jgi:hypothetical protein
MNHGKVDRKPILWEAVVRGVGGVLHLLDHHHVLTHHFLILEIFCMVLHSHFSSISFSRLGLYGRGEGIKEEKDK